MGLLVDRENVLYVADSGNNVVKRVNLTDGVITIVNIQPVSDFIIHRFEGY